MTKVGTVLNTGSTVFLILLHKFLGFLFGVCLFVCLFVCSLFCFVLFCFVQFLCNIAKPLRWLGVDILVKTSIAGSNWPLIMISMALRND